MDPVDAILELQRLKTYLKLSAEDFGVFLQDKLEALDYGANAIAREVQREEAAARDTTHNDDGQT